MSHISKIQIVCRSLAALEEGAAMCGLVMRKQDTHKWFGRWVGDYPMPAGLKKKDLGRCDYALSLPNKPEAYEVGVTQNQDGTYSLFWDFYSGGYGIEEAIGNNGEKLIQAYSYCETKNFMRQEGWDVHESELNDGTRVLRCEQYQ